MKKIIIGSLISILFFSALFISSQPVKAWNHSTHTFITEQAWEIFQNDNQELLAPFQQYQSYVPDFLNKLVQGNLEADVHSTTVSDEVITIRWWGKKYTLYMPTSEHYYNPENGKGAFNYFRSAKQKSEEYYDLALQNWRDEDYETSVYNLGRAMHLVQDVTIPHHTYNGANALLNQIGYSNWMDKHLDEYKVESEGIYNVQNIGDLVRSNSAISHPLLKYVDGLNPWWIFKIYTKDDYGRAARTVMPLAQRTCAGLIYKYANDVLTIEAAKVLTPKTKTKANIKKFE